MARPNKGALQRTRKSEVLVIAAFALSACEAFLIYRNFRMSVLESPTPTVSLLGGFISVCVTLAACLAMFAAYVLSPNSSKAISPAALRFDLTKSGPGFRLRK